MWDSACWISSIKNQDFTQILCVLPAKAKKVSSRSTENIKYGDLEESELVEFVLNLLGQKYYVLTPKSMEMLKHFTAFLFPILNKLLLTGINLWFSTFDKQGGTFSV